MKFRNVIYIITGFLQTSGSRSGLIDLWRDLYVTHAEQETLVRLLPWRSDWSAEGEFIFRLSEPRPSIGVVAFSWGAGWGFVRLAKALNARGLEVRHACLIDPVYRHSYWLGQWRAFVPGIPIAIPSNVRRVTWWRQQQDWPRGHKLTGSGNTVIANTVIAPPINVSASHVYMDDNPAILKACQKAMEDVAA